MEEKKAQQCDVPGNASYSKRTHSTSVKDSATCHGYAGNPFTVSKEPYYSIKRALLQYQKSPITVSKEPYSKEP